MKSRRMNVIAAVLVTAMVISGTTNIVTPADAAAKAPRLSKEALKLKVGDTKKLTIKNIKKKNVKKIKVTSSREDVATASVKKEKLTVTVKAKKKGTANISVTLRLKKKIGSTAKYKLKCEVSVEDADPAGTTAPGVTPDTGAIPTEVPLATPSVTATPSSSPSATPAPTASPSGSEGGSSSGGGYVTPTSSPKRVLSQLTLKHNVFSTFVSGYEGICPSYVLRKGADTDDFSIWKNVKMTIDDPSIAELGSKGLVKGKKTGTTTVKITATDGSGLQVTAKLKVVATESDLSKKDDLYKAVRNVNLPDTSGWDEEKRADFYDEKGNLLWSRDDERDYDYKLVINVIRRRYSVLGSEENYATMSGRPADGTPKDALASLMSTADVMEPGDQPSENSQAENKFYEFLHNNITNGINSVTSIDELIECSEELVANGLDGFINLDGFSDATSNPDYSVEQLQKLINGKDLLPDEEIELGYYYAPKVDMANMPSSNIYQYVKSESTSSNVEEFVRSMLTALGMGNYSELENDKYVCFDEDGELLDGLSSEGISGLMQLLESIANASESEDSDDSEYATFNSVCEKYPNLKIKEHFVEKGNWETDTRKGYAGVQDDDVIGLENSKQLEILDEYIRTSNVSDVEKLLVLKLFLALTSTAKLMPYTYTYWYEESSHFSTDEPDECGKKAKEELENKLEKIYEEIPFDMDQVYTQSVFTHQEKEQFESLVDEYKAAYKEAIENSEYGTKTKINMLNKLNNMRFEILYPDNDTYEQYQVGDLKTASEGATLAENLIEIRKYTANLEKMTVRSRKGEYSWWDPDDKVFDSALPDEDNAFYMPTQNRCMFMHGGIGPDSLCDFTDPSNPLTVRNIAFTAAHIGHEMGHAFDRRGTRLNANGNLQNLWGDGDKAKYDRKVDKLTELYDTMLMWPWKNTAYYKKTGCVTSEAMADLGGTEIALRILKKHRLNTEENLREFFTDTALVWIATDAKEEPKDQKKLAESLQEVHPYSRQRANGIASMMNDYYSVFGIGVQDAMYVAPDDRVELWKSA